MERRLIGPDQETALFLARQALVNIAAEDAPAIDLRERLTLSKLRTFAWLEENAFPVPARFPGGSEPYIIRPDQGPGCTGLWVTEDFCEAGGAVNCGCLVQEYLEGPLLCAQVTGSPEEGYTVHPFLQLQTDDRHVPLQASLTEAPELEPLALAVAQGLGLRGYLCLKAVEGRLVSLDDSLRGLPPRALYELTGLNLLLAMPSP